MTDYTRKKIWQNPHNLAGDIRKNPEITIDCFPYGVAENIDESLDLIDDIKSPATTYPLILFGTMLCAIVLLWNYVPIFRLFFATALETLLKEPIALIGTAIYLFLITSSVLLIGQKNNLMVPKLIKRQTLLRHDLFKLKTIVAGANHLYFHVCNQEPISLPWSVIDNIMLSLPEENMANKLALVLQGPKLLQPVPIAITSIHTHENWMILKQAIENYAPHIRIDPNIARAFNIPSIDTFFTDIWLDSLAQAPEANSLISLPAGLNLCHQKYVILTQLASGGQGHAYLARETASNKEVVVKEYLLPIYQNKPIRDAALKELEAEAFVLQLIHHPKIVQFLDWFTEADRAFLVLNHVDGLNLKAWVKQNGQPSPDLLRELAKQMCEILIYLHNSTPPIIHRDFTPDNLLLDSNRQLTLIDFNIAEPTGAVTNLPPAGKPAYMPPEQFRGRSNIQSDLYALGGTLYFLTTGHDPVALEQPEINTDSPNAIIEQIIYTCRAQLSENRYRNAQEIMDLLQSAP